MKYADIAGLSAKDLMKKTKELRNTMFESRMKNALGQLANPMTIRSLRRDVARMKTALTAKLNALVGEAAPVAKAAKPKKAAAPKVAHKAAPKKSAAGAKSAKASAKG